jgi:hypothetical protein
MKMRWPLGVALLLGCALASTALDNGLNAKPALGFNSELQTACTNCNAL